MSTAEIIALAILGAGFVVGTYFVFFRHGAAPRVRRAREDEGGRAEGVAADQEIESEIEREVGVDPDVAADEAKAREASEEREREKRRAIEAERERARRAEADKERARVEEEKRRQGEEKRRRAEEEKAAAEREAAERAEKAKAREKKLQLSLEKTKSGWVSKLSGLFGAKKAIEPNLLERVEEVLLTADIGVATTLRLIGALKEKLATNALTDSDAVFRALKNECLAIFGATAGAIDRARVKPFVTLVVGVNGVGKTTTIGKLAAKWSGGGAQKVVVAAGDTFRAAAVEQLEVWATRVGAECIRGKDGTDPASVVFDAVKRGVEIGATHVIADTAGRLHTKQNLVEELKKVKRVASKAMDGAPHEVLLVLDATTGQNAIAQAKVFTEALNVDGIILTKLDGTAKGGVVLGVAAELKLPVRYIGIGETVDDLREFDAREFVEALFEEANA